MDMLEETSLVNAKPVGTHMDLNTSTKSRGAFPESKKIYKVGGETKLSHSGSSRLVNSYG